MQKNEFKLLNIVKIVLLLLTVVLSSVSLKAQNDLYGLWARKAGVLGSDASIRVDRMQLDSQGNVYVAGYFIGPVSLSDNTCTLITTGGHPFTQDKRYDSFPHPSGVNVSGATLKTDAFISKYNEEGKWEWTVTAGSEIGDNIADIVLTDNEQTLTFVLRYGNASYSGMLSGSCKITYGDGNSELLENPEEAYKTFNKVSLIKINTADGSKVFNQFFGVGKFGTNPCTSCFLYVSKVKEGPSGNLMILGTEDNPYREHIWTFDAAGNFVDKKSSAIRAGGVTSIQAISKNATLNHFYGHRSRTVGGLYQKSIAKYDINASVLDTELAHASNTAGTGNDYLPGFTPYGMDVNNADSHLFMAGMTHVAFTYLPTNVTIPFKGGESDAFIACYNPQNTNSATNLRWLIQLGADGHEGVIDCQYHEATATLRVVGWITDKEINFNPLGTPMKKKGTAPGKYAMFYAIYNNNGICQSVTLLDQQIVPAKMELAGDNVTVFGAIYESPAQVDPSGRLRPIRATGSGTFLAKYSSDPTSVPLPIEPSSFSASDNITSTYGLATHDVQSCLRLGTLNNLVTEAVSLTYMPANSATGVVNTNYDGLTSIVVGANGKAITASVKVVNEKASPAYLAAWIDFNKDGIYDPSEVSNIVTIENNTGTATVPVSIDTLKWTNMPAGTVVNGNLENLRIRLSSEQMDGTWHAGHAADGEVEDYLINIRLNSLLKDDFTYTFACDSININVLANDDTLANSQITLVAPHPSYITLKDGNIIYDNKAANCCTEGNKNIFVKYSVCNSVITHCDTATLKVQILRCPQIMLKDSCSFSPSLRILDQYSGTATYQWQHSVDGTVWTDIVLATGSNLDISQLKHEYYYRVNVVYGHSKATTEEHQFIIIKEVNISNRTWYETSLQ